MPGREIRRHLLHDSCAVTQLPFIAIGVKAVCVGLVRSQRQKVDPLVETPQKSAMTGAYPLHSDDFIVDAQAITEITFGQAFVITDGGQCLGMGHYLPNPCGVKQAKTITCRQRGRRTALQGFAKQ